MLDGTTQALRHHVTAAQAFSAGEEAASDLIYDDVQAARAWGHSGTQDRPRAAALKALETYAKVRGIDLHAYPCTAFVSGFLTVWCDEWDGHARQMTCHAPYAEDAL